MHACIWLRSRTGWNHFFAFMDVWSCNVYTVWAEPAIFLGISRYPTNISSLKCEIKVFVYPLLPNQNGS
jgi:hypothetical protein